MTYLPLYPSEIPTLALDSLLSHPLYRKIRFRSGINGVADEALPDPEELERVTMAVASHAMTKEEVTQWLREWLQAFAIA
jgi:hypothetical protein